MWKIPPKVKSKPLIGIKVRISFYLLEIRPGMYILRESWESRDFEKIKFFWFLMLFCIQNGIWVKMWVFGFLRSEHKILATGKTSASYLPIFYWERGYMHKNMILSFFVPFCTQNGILGVGNFGHQQFLGRKIDFFRFFKNVF